VAGAKTQRELYALFKAWGLPVLPGIVDARGVEEIAAALEKLRRTRTELAFPVDGAVVKLNDVAQQRAIGANETSPHWAIAYKFAPERVETQLRGIALQVGRTGVLTPVAELIPVELAGSKIARATLHNGEEIARKDIRVGDFVYIEKAGDVIPAIVGVNLERRSDEVVPYQFPIGCPECYAPLVRAEKEVAIRCPNHECPAQLRRRLEHFASKGCVDIEGLGPTMIETLVDNGWVKEVPDIYRLRRADLLGLGKNNERSTDRLLAAIEKSKGTELWRVIHGLGLPQVGAATAKNLARQCGSLAALAETGPKAAMVLGEPRYQRLIADLISVGLAPVVGRSSALPLAGKILVLTGTLPTLSRAQATTKIEAAGGKVAGAVSASTDFVVAGADPGTKLEEAHTKGILVLDETALLRMMEPLESNRREGHGEK
jgi:DNA ligase (NAD+)